MGEEVGLGEGATPELLVVRVTAILVLREVSQVLFEGPEFGYKWRYFASGHLMNIFEKKYSMGNTKLTDHLRTIHIQRHHPVSKSLQTLSLHPYSSNTNGTPRVTK